MANREASEVFAHSARCGSLLRGFTHAYQDGITREGVTFWNLAVDLEGVGVSVFDTEPRRRIDTAVQLTGLALTAIVIATHRDCGLPIK